MFHVKRGSQSHTKTFGWVMQKSAACKNPNVILGCEYHCEIEIVAHKKCGLFSAAVICRTIDSPLPPAQIQFGDEQG